MPRPIEVRKVPINHVSDASGLAELIDSGVMEADRVIAVIGKTEGNGGGERRSQRLHPYHRRSRVPRGAGSPGQPLR